MHHEASMVNEHLSETKKVFMALDFVLRLYCMPTVPANNRKQDGSFMLYIYLTLPLAQATWCTYIHTYKT